MMPAKRELVGALFAGRLNDGGFMEFGHRGLTRAIAEFGIETTIIDQILPQPEALMEALHTLVRRGATLIIAHGGQNDAAAQSVAATHPQLRFVVTQGSVHAANLSSYEVRQEQSAFLAGIAAAHLSSSGVVGHISGIRVRPGLMGRAAFAAGVTAANPNIRLLTTFCGTQDDPAVAQRVAEAQIAAGADVVFTMLNAAMPGAMAACHAHGTRLIGNVRDWVRDEPGVFAASAMADVGIGVYEACRDLVHDTWKSNCVRRFGVDNPAAVRLRLAADCPAAIAGAVALWQGRLLRESFEWATDYSGPEFTA